MDHLSTALAALKENDRDQAAAALGRLMTTPARLGRTWGSISRLALKLGEIDAALEAARRYAGESPGEIGPKLEYIQTLALFGRSEEAEAEALALTTHHPGHPAAWHILGTCRAQRGSAETASEDFRRAIDLAGSSPAAATPWLGLSAMKRFKADDPDLKQLETRVGANQATPPGELNAQLLYALGKAYDDCGRPEAAFAAYAEGASIVRRGRAQAPGTADSFVDAVQSSFTREGLDALPSGPSLSDRPIFVIGSPRSGTTLVEQILAGHDSVSGGGELNLFKSAAIPVGGFSYDALARASAGNPDVLRGVANAYLRMLDERFVGDGRVVDKTLNHSRYLGLIHKTFPQARVVWMRRTPAATAWSCFRTWFGQGMGWTWDLADIGHYLRHEDRLFEHWMSVLGDVVLPVSYEDLVSDPEREVGRILDHVSLAPQDGLLDFHKSGRSVATASFAQVRRPVYRTSESAWRSYESEMAPFFAAYGHAGG